MIWWIVVNEVEKTKSTEHERKFRLQILEMRYQHSYTKLTVARFPKSLFLFLGVAIVLVKLEL